MKALVKSKAEKGIWMEEVPMPKVGPNDVLIKIKKAAICGTDLHIYKWDEWAQQTIKTPVTIGHEYMGTVIETGSEVTRVRVGERVTVEGHISCGFCRNCRRGRQHICDNTVGIGVQRDGGFAEYISVPAKNVLHVDANIPDEIMSIMDPFGNATHTALSFPLLGEDVLITGIGGPIGAMAAAICRFAGARNVIGTDLSPFRRALARKLGATRVIDPTKESITEAMQKHNMVAGFDIGLECSGSPAAFNDMVNHMYNGGKISLLGILPQKTQINWNKVIFKGLTLKGIYGREMYETWYQMEMMLTSGLDISHVITHRFPADDFQQAFEIMEQGDCGKIILDWE
ncbi:L-threonine 3-dehydrogenase [Mariniphaga anaerophila]|uniref:L-threonine 3-dehydrogenase n=1 Tax=Mariniphaga anaerophila TaxID=1484053 RepID=A0A1M5ELS6_9BACT|nr:L-threonine 3-dehydrogenase [Mariniphaga anaerophila]SHF80070.1 L-threonine 3-dehydrogenase [Mariniphaga anaerophila]